MCVLHPIESLFFKIFKGRPIINNVKAGRVLIFVPQQLLHNYYRHTDTSQDKRGRGGEGGVLITYSDEQLEINFLGCIHI